VYGGRRAAAAAAFERRALGAGCDADRQRRDEGGHGRARVGCDAGLLERSIERTIERIVERPVASVAGFKYSAALKAKGGKWTFAALNKWLTDPRGDVPGTSMTFVGVQSEKQRADLIAYLDTLSKNPVPLPKAQ